MCSEECMTIIGTTTTFGIIICCAICLCCVVCERLWWVSSESATVTVTNPMVIAPDMVLPAGVETEIKDDDPQPVV